MRAAARILVAGIAVLYAAAVLWPCALGAWGQQPVLSATAPPGDNPPPRFSRHCPCQCGHEDATATVAGEWQGPRSAALPRIGPPPPRWRPAAGDFWAGRAPAPPDPIPISLS